MATSSAVGFISVPRITPCPARGEGAPVARARRLERFLTQPFFTTEAFTGRAGRMVTLEETLESCERILAGEFADRPEHAFYMIGGLSDLEEPTGASAAPDGSAGS